MSWRFVQPVLAMDPSVFRSRNAKMMAIEIAQRLRGEETVLRASYECHASSCLMSVRTAKDAVYDLEDGLLLQVTRFPGRSHWNSFHPLWSAWDSEKRASAAPLEARKRATPKPEPTPTLHDVIPVPSVQSTSERAAAVPQLTTVRKTRAGSGNHYSVITALVTKEVLPLRLEDHELMAATMQRCKRLGIACDDVVVKKAIDSALFRYYRQMRLDHGLPPDPRGFYRDHIRPKKSRGNQLDGTADEHSAGNSHAMNRSSQ
jgi:hypothetical protein